MKGRIRRMLQGEQRWCVTGTQTARFLSLLLKKGVLYRDLEAERGRLHLTTAYRDRAVFLACAEKTGTGIQAEGESGLPLWRKKYRNRWAFLAAMVLSFGLLYASAQRIWSIRIEGTVQLTETEMRARLEEHGITEGMRRRTLKSEELRERLLLDYPDLSWLSLTVDGTCLIVRTAEVTVGPGLREREDCFDLAAAKTCIVYSIVTERGTPLVRRGDVVQEGDRLILGRVTLQADDGTETYQYGEARGCIYGKCRYELSEAQPAEYMKKIYGKNGRGWRICWGKNAFSIKNPFRSWEKYDTISGLTKWLNALSGGPRIWLEKQVYCPYEEQPETYTEEEMEQLLKERLELRKVQLLAECRGVLLEEEYRSEETEQGRRGVLVLSVMEEIGREVPPAENTEERDLE